MPIKLRHVFLGAVGLAAAAVINQPDLPYDVTTTYALRLASCVSEASRLTSDYNQLHHTRVAQCLNGGSLAQLGPVVPVQYWPSYAKDALGFDTKTGGRPPSPR